MAAIPAVYLKLIGELILFVVILWATFSPEGIMSNTAVYINSIEPCLIQNWMVTGISVADWAPGEFGTTYKTLGSPHTIKLHNIGTSPALTVKQASGIQMDVKFNCLVSDIGLPSTSCAVSEMNVKLSNSRQNLFIGKYPGNICQVNMTVGS